jgi:hypothetical protein
MSSSIERFVAAAPAPQRFALRAMLALARRPRGATLLARVPLLAQAATATLAFERFDEPARAAQLGWDAEAVVAHGRALRRSEGRP